jgi:F-type H+-transporting ATPase subunit a
MHVSLAPQALFSLGSVTVTNTILTTVISSVLLIAALIWAAHKVTLRPAGGFAGAYEAICSAVLDQAEQTFGSSELALRYFPLLATFFIFILLGNTLGLLPGFDTLELHGVPLFRSVTTDLNTTVALAIISVVLTQVYAIRTLGVVGNLHRYFSTNPMMNMLGVLEIFLELTRLISFSFRLFGNIFAGEVMLIIVSSLVPVLGPSPFWGFELFVGFIQAFVFTMLTMVFISLAIHPVGHDGPAPSKIATNE